MTWRYYQQPNTSVNASNYTLAATNGRRARKNANRNRQINYRLAPSRDKGRKLLARMRARARKGVRSWRFSDPKLNAAHHLYVHCRARKRERETLAAAYLRFVMVMARWWVRCAREQTAEFEKFQSPKCGSSFTCVCVYRRNLTARSVRSFGRAGEIVPGSLFSRFGENEVGWVIDKRRNCGNVDFSYLNL